MGLDDLVARGQSVRGIGLVDWTIVVPHRIHLDAHSCIGVFDEHD